MKPRPITGELQWGGKSAGVLLLRELGLETPISFGLTLKETGDWLRRLPDFAEAMQAWKRWPGPEAESPEALEKFRKTVLHSLPPENWTLASSWLRHTLSGCPAIVRSSMSAEDGGRSSMAGAFESVRVQKPTPEILWRALAAVLASAYTREAALRLLASGLDPIRFVPSALFQPWIEPKVSGVCFSRDPLSPWSRRGLAEWTDEPGASVVQGQGRVFRARQAEAPHPSIEPFAEQLWRAAELAEEKLGVPADLEWAWDGSQLWFLQLRPIATEEARVLGRCLSTGARLSRELAEERFPEPMTSLGWTVIEDTLAPNLTALEQHFGIVPESREGMATSVRGWIYSDPDFFDFPRRVKIRWRRFLATGDGHVTASLRAVARHVLKPSVPLLKLDITMALLEPQAEAIHDAWELHVEDHLALLRSFPKTLSTPSLLQAMEDLRRVSLSFLEPDLAIFLVKDSLRKALLGTWTWAGLAESDFPRLVSAFHGNRTLSMSEDWDLLVRALSSDRGAREFLRTLDPVMLAEDYTRECWNFFLARNGHCRTSWDIALPGWAEEPSRLAAALEASLSHCTDATRRASDRRQQARDELFARLDNLGFKNAIPRVGRAILLLEDFMRMDEELHFLSGLLLEPSRRVVLEAGRMLCRQNDLEEPNDVFHLELAELKAHLRARGPSPRFLAKRRRAEWERSRKFSLPSELPAPPSEAPQIAEPGRLQGVPVSPGVVVGPLHVVAHLEDALDLPHGAVLITTSPNPALVPLYPVLGGMICATGGMLSHGFVAAREFGLPAVSGVRGLNEEDLVPGRWVRLDGATGKIEILGEKPS